MLSVSLRAVAATVVVLVAGAGVAAATPLEAKRKGSNNFVEIVYDDVTGIIEPTGVEGIATTTKERFRMWVDVTSDPAAEPGSRLLGNLRLYLRGKQAMSFAGIFKIVFLDSLNGGRTSFEVEDAFVLRPRPGQRSHRIDLVFDLPSGTYLYFGRYKPY